MILNNSSETDLCIYFWQYCLCYRLFCLDPPVCSEVKDPEKISCNFANMLNGLTIFYIASLCNIKKIGFFLSIKFRNLIWKHFSNALWIWSGGDEEKEFPHFFPMLSCSKHFPHCVQSLQESHENQVLCLLSSNSFSLTPCSPSCLSESFCTRWMVKGPESLPCSRGRDVEFLCASVQESNTTNDTQLPFHACHLSTKFFS